MESGICLYREMKDLSSSTKNYCQYIYICTLQKASEKLSIGNKNDNGKRVDNKVL